MAVEFLEFGHAQKSSSLEALGYLKTIIRQLSRGLIT
jgi:hypothetical protein